MRTVNREEIQKIEAFLEKKDIVYYDLKIELIDHICQVIESKWEKNPEITFEHAFHEVYKSFGIFGFSEILEEREKALKKHYWKITFKELLKWFRIPQISLVFLVGFAIFQILKSPIKVPFIQYGIPILFLFSLYKMYLFRKESKRNNKQIVMDRVILNSMSIPNYLAIQLLVLHPPSRLIGYILFTLIFTVYLFLNYHQLFVLPKKKEQLFKKQYHQLYKLT
ncbi:MAG: hypothetical protein N4A45_13365 [Flavobacteriales bacterium]|jgi:hypothetical protein|nr:hypothetical protein [Flavobacteriales bacterium]